jgi:hypothetical protein
VAGAWGSLWEDPNGSLWLVFTSAQVPDDYTWYDPDDCFSHESLGPDWHDYLEEARSLR